MNRQPFIAASIALVAMSCLVAPTASAAPAKLTPPSWLLSRQDVPPELGTPKAGKDNYLVSGMFPVGMDICVAASSPTPLSVSGAAGWQATVVLNGKNYSAVNERVNTFAADSAAASTFAALQSTAAQCNGTSTSPLSTDSSHPINGKYVNTNTTGTTGTGVWVNVSSKVQSPDPKINGTVTNTYTVYRLNQNVIVATWYYVNGASKATPSQRAAVDSLSASLTAM